MKNSIGSSVSVTLFGESHGPAVGAVIDGLAPGIRVDVDYIESKLEQRKPYGRISTTRHEDDEFSIISGVYNGMTCGTPICIVIPNNSQRSEDYNHTDRPARPGHADYTAYAKYHGFEDPRGGGHFSGRITAALTAAGAILMNALEDKGIKIGTHISMLGGICDCSMGKDEAEISANIDILSTKRFPVLGEEASKLMQELIENASREGDSVGGVLETAVCGVDPGIGEPWFDTLEGVLAHGIYSIPGIKGVEFGLGFEGTLKHGSEYNDALYMSEGRVITKTNNNGGINGGISSGMPIMIRSAVKPTPSIYKEQKTIDINSMADTVLNIRGRHDPAVIHRARIVVDSVVAMVLADTLSLRYGTDWLAETEESVH